MATLPKPRVLVVVDPEVLDDVIVRLLGVTGRFEVVRPSDVTSGPIDAAILSGGAAEPPAARVTIRLPADGTQGVGGLTVGARTEAVSIAGWADVVGLLNEHLPRVP